MKILLPLCLLFYVESYGQVAPPPTLPPAAAYKAPPKESSSPKSTGRIAKDFMQALHAKELSLVESDCTPAMKIRMHTFMQQHYPLESLSYQKGSTWLTKKGVTLNDVWKLKFGGQPEGLYTVHFELVKDGPEWKVADFDLKPYNKR